MAKSAQNGVSLGESAEQGLYERGLAHYRRREWQEAHACFRQLKEEQPNRPRLDALLHELEALTRADSADDRASRGAEDGPAGVSRLTEQNIPGAPDQPEETPRGRRRGRRWLGIAGVCLLGLATVALVYLYHVGGIPLLSASDVRAARNRCRSRVVAEKWCEALAACGELAALVPDDPEALNQVGRAKSALYDTAQEHIEREQLEEALAALRCLAEHDASYGDVGELLSETEQRQARTQRYETLIADLQRVSASCDERDHSVAVAGYDRVKVGIEGLRHADPNFQSQAISHLLYRVHMERGACYLGWVAAELSETTPSRLSEPRYVITDSLLAKLRSAVLHFQQALQERPDAIEAQTAARLTTGTQEGLERYSDWAWAQSIAALGSVCGEDAAYLGGKAALVLCDAYVHLGDLHLEAGAYEAALAAYRAMEALGVCEAEVVAARIERAVLPLTPTATVTPTPTQTPTHTWVPTATQTPTETATPQPTQKKKSATKAPAPPTPKPRTTRDS